MVATIENDFLKLSVKGSGAEMVSLKGLKDDVEYVWQGNPEFWPRRAPVLFPIVGKLKDHKLRLNGEEYVLPQHGFARNLMFDLHGGTSEKLVFRLASNNETRKQLPYHFELFITYVLTGKKVTVIYEVKNTDNKQIFFSIGAHPGFNIPAYPGDTFEDYYIEFDKPENTDRLLLEDGLFNGKSEPILSNTNTLPLKHELFDKDAIVLKGLKSDSLSLKSKKSGYHLNFNFTGFPYMGIWSPKGQAPFICIEPWYGLADSKEFDGDFSKKEGVVSLSTNEKFECSYSFEIQSAK